MQTQSRDHDRRWGLALIAFLPLQLVFFGIDVAITPSALDAPAEEFRTQALEHAAMMRWAALITLVGFVGLLVPASYALRRRLRELSPHRSVWPDLLVAGSLLLTMTVLVATTTFAVLGLVPADELSDSVIYSAAMTQLFAGFVAGSFAIALLTASASMAMLQARPAAPRLAWFGLATAGLSLISQLWFVTGDLHGPLYELNGPARAIFLVWVATAGVWLSRAVPADGAEAAPAAEAGLGAATP
jgi:hypothetical protein